MSDPVNYAALDTPGVLANLFHPQAFWTPPPLGTSDYLLPVGGGVLISSRFYPKDRQAPTIIFFHGNGEVACQYDDTAEYYMNAGANLFVMDYRGYGQSGGTPTFAAMMADALVVYGEACRVLDELGYSGSRLVMGRSLGSQSAIQIGAQPDTAACGVIIESGFAGAERLIARLGLGVGSQRLVAMTFRHAEKLRSVSLPLLVIHGEDDAIVPVDAAAELYDGVSSKEKAIVILPGAGHNDILWTGMEPYFASLRSFVEKRAVTPTAGR